MKATAIIAEDEAALAQALQMALAKAWPELKIVGIAPNGLEALALIEREAPQIAFLDIRMPGLTGLEVAARAGDGTHLVFVTAYSEHAVAAFEREAVDYVLKPISEDRIVATVERLQRKLNSQVAPEITAALKTLAQFGFAPANASAATGTGPLKFLRCGLGDTVQIVPTDDVVYLQAQDKYVSVFTDDTEHLIRISLKELMDQLDGAQFVQVHRSTVVNLRAVDRAERDWSGKVTLSLKGRKETVQVSRQHAQLFARM
jgi:DNA-binding LytR/AlgR family response regulator